MARDCEGFKIKNKKNKEMGQNNKKKNPYPGKTQYLT